ncbi:hypothetical protein MSHOH_1287 [Methanosarcina horonobensis HB-1 = JCM 15518]|uniref:Uncharacterized protein n=1 Tax=Methanosarcina horonobensis HB-1 = JCM 15518 TaxID=1434110 RepID=A0A0E3WTG0_9EURY|nr:hypothetical protein MSHOH_1287 [Methanosarcina horonobensis HB-1 = JCM 15518]
MEHKGENIWNEKVSRAEIGTRVEIGVPVEEAASAESRKRCTKQNVLSVIWKQRCPLSRTLTDQSTAGSATQRERVESFKPDGLFESLLLTD